MAQVLVVDDEAGMPRLMRRFAEIDGYDVDEAETAEDAIASVRRASPAVALCDVHLPGANGLWLAEQVRNVSPGTAIILATGDSSVPPSDSLRAGVIAYLVKPFDRASLQAALADGVRWSTDERARLTALTRGQLDAGVFDAIDAGLEEPA
jgi:DNA-binding NtrC family response regulator